MPSPSAGWPPTVIVTVTGPAASRPRARCRTPTATLRRASRRRSRARRRRRRAARPDLSAGVDPLQRHLAEAAVLAREVGRLAQAHAGARGLRRRELDEVEAGRDRRGGLAGRPRAGGSDQRGGRREGEHEKEEAAPGRRKRHGSANAANRTNLRARPALTTARASRRRAAPPPRELRGRRAAPPPRVGRARPPERRVCQRGADKVDARRLEPWVGQVAPANCGWVGKRFPGAVGRV